MDNTNGLFKAYLTPEEYTGYLKSSIVMNALGIIMGNSGASALTVKVCLDELMAVNAESRKETPEPKKAKTKEKAGAKKAPVQKKTCTNGNDIREGVDLDKVRELYIEKNLTAEECCKQLGISPWKFRMILFENDIKKNQNNGDDSDAVNLNEIKRLYLTLGLTAAECSKRLGISKSTFFKILRKNGIVKREKSPHAGDYDNYDEDAVDKAAKAAARDILESCGI